MTAPSTTQVDTKGVKLKRPADMQPWMVDAGKFRQDLYFRINPGSDGILALGVAKLLIDQNLRFVSNKRIGGGTKWRVARLVTTQG